MNVEIKEVFSVRPVCPFCKKLGLIGFIRNNKTICNLCNQQVLIFLNDHKAYKPIDWKD